MRLERDTFAGVVALGVMLLTLKGCLLLFFLLDGVWAWLAPLGLFLAGGAASERLHRRLSTAEGWRREMEDRVRNGDA